MMVSSKKTTAMIHQAKDEDLVEAKDLAEEEVPAEVVVEAGATMIIQEANHLAAVALVDVDLADVVLAEARITITPETAKSRMTTVSSSKKTTAMNMAMNHQAKDEASEEAKDLAEEEVRAVVVAAEKHGEYAAKKDIGTRLSL